MPRSARAKRTAHDEIARLLHDPDADPARLEQMTVRQLAEEVRFCHRKLAEYEAARAQPSPEPPRNLPQDLPTDEFEQELRHAIDVIPALLWSSDPDGAIDYVNDSWLSYTGMTLDQALDMGWAQALHPDDAAETERSWSAAVQSGTVFEVEQRLRRHDGDYHWFLARARPAVGADGRVQKWYGASTDITEYKRVQKSLAYQAHLLENISEAIIASDEHYRLTAWNAAAAAMYGWSAEQVLGRTGLDVIQTRFSEADKSQMLQQIATQGYYHGRATQARKDGSRFPVDVSSYVLRDEAGRVTGFVSINRDITAQLQAEEILRESEARFSSIFYASPVGILVFRRRDDCVVDCNDAFLDLTGYTREELLEHAPDELGLFPNPDERRAWLLRLQSRSGVRNISLTLRKKSGEIRFAMVSMALFEARAEPLVMLLAIDITSLKRAEAQLMLAETELEQKVIERTAELRIQQQILQIFVEHAPAAIAMLDKDLRFLAVSRRYLEDYRLGEHPLLGRKYEEVFPATSERWRAIYQACLAGEVEKREEDLFQHADGSLDWVRWEAHPWYQRPNQVGGIFIFSELITERKRAEQDLLETQRRLQMAVRSGKTGLWDWNLHTNRVHYSLEYKQLLGHTDQEFSDHYLEWESRLHPDDRRHALDVQTDFLQQPAHGYWNRFRMRHKDGGYRWILAQGDLLYDTQGRPERMLGSIIDITELVRAQEIIEEKMAEVELVNRDLARALQTKDEFLNAMSHELRTPLTGVLGLAEALQYQTYGPMNDKQLKALANIEHGGRRLLELVNELLDYTALQSGQFALDIALCSLSEVCSAGLRAVQEQAAARQLLLGLTIVPDPVLVKADQRRLKQILRHLLDNAIKFSSPEGQIWVKVTGDAGQRQVRISVIDEGIGIRDEDLPRLFQPFVQLDARLARRYEGAGLGLAVVKGLVDLHRGRVEVESAPGKGSCFTVILPWDDAPGAAEPSGAAEPPGAALPPPRSTTGPPAEAGR